MRLNFLRTPKYQKFHIEPRYYDPVREELDERQKRISMRIRADKDHAPLDESADKSSIAGSFTRRRSSSNSSSSFMQLIIMILISGLIFGYIFYGQVALYAVIALSSVLLYLKVKRIL